MWAEFYFIRPWLLLLVPLSIGLWLLWNRSTDPLRGWRRRMDPDLLNALSEGSSNRPRNLLSLIAMCLAAVSVAGPTWRYEPSPFADDATKLMVLLKADESMETTDLQPTRMDRAGLKVTDLAELRSGQPLGLVAYAGSAHLVLPPTRDTAIVGEMAREIGPGIMPIQGDRLDLALQRASETLNEAGGSILILADGAIPDRERLSEVDTSRIDIHLLGMTDAAEIPSELKETASILGARMHSLTADSSDIETIVRQISRNPIAISEESGTRWEEAGYVLTPVIALLSLGLFRREKRNLEAEK